MNKPKKKPAQALLAACIMLVFCLAYYSTLKTCSSETSADFHRTIWRFITEDRNLHNHRYETFTSDMYPVRLASQQFSIVLHYLPPPPSFTFPPAWFKCCEAVAVEILILTVKPSLHSGHDFFVLMVVTISSKAKLQPWEKIKVTSTKSENWNTNKRYLKVQKPRRIRVSLAMLDYFRVQELLHGTDSAGGKITNVSIFYL
jgi:hypothetical protein